MVTPGPICQFPLACISRQLGRASAPTIPQTASCFTRLRKGRAEQMVLRKGLSTTKFGKPLGPWAS